MHNWAQGLQLLAVEVSLKCKVSSLMSESFCTRAAASIFGQFVEVLEPLCTQGISFQHQRCRGHFRSASGRLVC